MRLIFFLLLLATPGFSQTLDDFIAIDQFGYREQAKKTAVISYDPGNNFQVINETSGAAVFSGTPVPFNSGETDAASGDEIWHFDFSSVTAPGRYYILDQTNNRRSFSFSIANNVYNDVLQGAVKMLYYQRAGTDKPAQYAGESWADGLNFSQDAQTRLFSAKDDASTEKDLKGGWFDAGDYNKYTKWTADYVETMLLTFEENPDAFTDDYGIPESGNGVPDILDEAKWGIEWLLKMQNADGSVLSVQGLGTGSPPSSVTRPNYYGPANATATFGAAKAFAIASRFFGARGETEYAEKLKTAAIKAWDWAVAYPDSIFHNSYDMDLAAGDQELGDEWDRVENYINAAFSLYEITGADSLLKIFENNLNPLPLYAWGNIMQQYRHAQHMLYMRYLDSPHGNASVKSNMRNKLEIAFAKTGDYLGAYQSDGYRSFIYAYQWGSNKVKTDYGLTFYKWNIVNPSADYKNIAEDYLHYIHGVNPLNTVYLSNMKSYGASKSLTSIYHTWFSEKSTKWSIATDQQPGPAPGYMPGGPNDSYGLDACCPSTCGSPANNARCSLVSIPQNQPPAKMYMDINHDWPINTWEISEPSNGYQLSYVRLLSKFVGNGGSSPVKKREVARPFKVVQSKDALQIFGTQALQVSIYKPNGKLLIREQSNSGTLNVNLRGIPSGIYMVQISNGSAKESRIISIFSP
ncbi:MAG: glycoside hydrolase family 9 protein [Candidatus Fibromonas sp.]|jgi:hypothetical protein|nr:glycoside hydrolase family 9 protein [Candidatus Fibromonas sp.]